MRIRLTCLVKLNPESRQSYFANISIQSSSVSGAARIIETMSGVAHVNETVCVGAHINYTNE